ncbi:acyl-CoA dehydrogenase [Stenotrophomonas maltophilia]|uniref:acyl-CoA dehydrogenase n=1 Tax=Stenotrophomonas maltophilia TaxID=40324 RepID=UPI0034DAF5F1
MLDAVPTATLANRARQHLLQHPPLPAPGTGRTLERWRALARLGAEDLCLAKVLEAHHDAAAILHELGAPLPAEGELWAVWAAEGPACSLRLDANGQLHGDKPWCSGSAFVDVALVTVRTPGGVQLYRVDASAWQTLDEGSWAATGMAGIPSTTARFNRSPATPIGAQDAYLQRPGFWHGGAGIAAVWWGAAVAVATRMQPAAGDELRARLLGRADLVLAPAAALLRELAVAIDNAPGQPHRADVVRARSVVERAAMQILDLAGRALGPAPMCMDAAHAQRWADLTVFLRQSHADRDWAWLGAQRAEQEDAWTL